MTQQSNPNRRRSFSIDAFKKAVASMFRAAATAVALGAPVESAIAQTTTPSASSRLGDETFFPIGVWQQSPFRAPMYKKLGINLFVALFEGPTESQLDELAKNGMFAIAEQKLEILQSPNLGVIKAWMQIDEPDNAQPIAGGRYGPCVSAATVAERAAAMKKADPTRPVFVNFGRGVADPSWIGRGTCTGDLGYYTVAAQNNDILSFDIYPASTNTPNVKGRLEYVAHGVNVLQNAAKAGQQVWTVIETTRISSETSRPTPQQIRSEVWLALTHGASGIIYFVHEFSGGFREDGIFRYPDAMEAVESVNTEIRELAPVLNQDSVADRVAVSARVPIGTILKIYKGHIYLFAASEGNTSEKAWMFVRGLGDTSAEVLGEGRTLDVKNGVLDDQFDSYGVHLYKIALK